MFRRILIMFFIAVSGFLVVSCFYRKANNKEPLTMYSVFYEMKNSEIGYDIQLDIEELATSMSKLSENFSNTGSDVFGKLASIGGMLYYFGRFVIKLIIHVLTSTLNVIILALRIIGFDNLSYIHVWSDEDTDVQVLPNVPKPTFNTLSLSY